MFPRPVSYGRASAAGQSLDMRDIQHSDGQTHRHRSSLTGRGFGFNDDHDRVPVEWFQYPDDEPQNPKATDAELAAMLTASTGRQVSAKVVTWNRLRLGLRKNRPKRNSPAWHAMLSERQRQVHARNPASDETRRKMSESAKRHHALTPISEETRRRISAATKASWAKRQAKGGK
jgi:hypothetical protein